VPTMINGKLSRAVLYTSIGSERISYGMI